MFLKIIENKIKRFVSAIRVFRLQCIDGVAIHNSAVVFKNVEVDAGGGRISIGKNTKIDVGVVLRAYGGVIEIGDNCFINPYTVLYGHGGLRIGDGVLIAAHSVVVPANHDFKNANEFIYRQPEVLVGIAIEDDVWLGAGVRILDGVTVSKGSVIGAGSVVTKSTEPYSINVGVPAKKIGSRFA